MDIVEKQSWARSWLILAICIALGFLFDYFFWEKIPGIGVVIYILLVVIGFFGIAFYSKKAVQGDVLWLLPVLIFFAAMIGIGASILLTILNIFACLLLLLLISEVSVRGSLRKFIVKDYLKLVLHPLRFISPVIRLCAEGFSIRKRAGEQNKTAQIVRGIFLTVPVLIVLSLLFAGADPVFDRYLSALTNWNVDPENVFRAFLIFGVTIALAGAYGYAFGGSAAQSQLPATNRRAMGHIETAILLSSVNILFLLFLIVQITYLFGAENNVTAEGFTYAEYARRGFFELIAVAIFSYLILMTTEKYTERGDADHSRVFKLLSTALVLQVAVIMVSAFSRLSLYEEAFGFTTLRLYSHAFIIFLGVIFVFLLYKILVENKEDTFAFRTFLSIVVFVVSMNLFNPDAFIAKKNLERYASTGKLDTAYLSTLSSDATSVTINTLSIDDVEKRSAIGRALYDRYVQATSQQLEWQSWNASREGERELLSERADELRIYKDYELPQAASTEGSGLFWD